MGFLLLGSTAQSAVFNLSPGPADGAAGSLRAALAVANVNGEDDTINLAAGAYTLTIANAAGQENAGAQGDLDITEAGFSITIQGAGAASTEIFQQSQDRIFQVLADATLTLSGVSLSGGTAVDNGGAGAAAGSGGRGGGILNEGGSLNLSASIIRNNVATGAGTSEGGGGIYQLSGAMLLIGGTSIVDNRATGNSASGGGIYMTNGTLTAMSQTVIDRNIANRAGGGVEIVNGTASFSGGATFLRDNQALGVGGMPGVAGNGGGLHITFGATVTLNNCVVSGNTAANEGGGLWNSFNGTLNVISTSVDGNTAEGNGGGGIFNNGGVLDLDSGAGPANVNGNVATGVNGAGDGGGILSIGAGIVTIDGAGIQISRVGSNTAAGDGGGITQRGGNLTLTGVDVDNNTGGLFGGGLQLVNTTTVLATTAVFDNQANLGGGVFQVAGSVTLANDAVINSNDALAGSGGGMYLDVNAVTNIFGEVSDNTSTGNGGGILHDGTDLTIDGATISGNTAAISGGAIHIVDNTQVANVINGSVIDGNLAGAQGGGVSIASPGGTLTVSDSTISNNVADSNNDGDGNGGGINNQGAGTATLFNAFISGNSAVDGGGIYNGDLGGNSGTLNLNVVNITDNIARRSGGGLYQRPAAGTLLLTNVNFDSNAANGTGATQGGGGIYNDGFAISLDSSVAVTFNTANMGSGSGGGIFNHTGGLLTLNGTIITGNQANRAGGGIEDNSGVGLGVILTNAVLDGNLALGIPGNGGGLHVTGAGDVNITGGSVSSNTASLEGGGLWNGTGTMTVINATIDGNTASGAAADDGGGGIFNNGGALNIQNGSITNNVANGAAGNGGGIHVNGGMLSANGVTMTGNSREGIFAGNGAAVDLTNVTSTALILGLEGDGAGALSLTGGLFSAIRILNSASVTTNGAVTSTGPIILETIGNIDVQTGGLNGTANLSLRPGGVATFASGTSSSYGGTVTLFTGSAVVDGVIGGAGSQFDVEAPALLGGSGQIQRNLIVAGTLAPGPIAAAPGDTGILTITGDVGFGAGSQFNVGINALGAGTGHDQLAVSGNVGMALGVPGVNLTGGATTTFADGDSFVIIDNDAIDPISGNFANAVPPSPPASIVLGAEEFDFDYTGGDGNDFVLGPSQFTDLVISKTDGVANAVPGASVTYTITASNSGMTAVSGNTVTDTFPVACSSVNWTCVGAGGGSCTAAGAGNISDSVDLPAGASVTYTAICNIAASATGTLNNTASIAIGAGVMDIDPTNNSATDSDPLTPTADLNISKDDGTATAIPGTSTTYSIAVNNPGPSNAVGLTVSDVFPAACTTVNWTCSGIGGGVCSASGSGDINDSVTLAANSTITYVAICDIDPAATGNLSNTASLTAPGSFSDPDPTNNSAADSDTLTPQADLDISKSDGVTTAVPGQSVVYTIIASNAAGPSDLSATVNDAFPAACTSVSWTCIGAGGGSCTAAGSGNITDAVSLPVGASVTYSATCNIDSAATGSLDNTASVAAAAGGTDPNPANDTATDTDTLTPQADLVVTKDDGVSSAIPGGSVTWTIVANNAAGPSDAVGATVSDNFPAACTSVSWTCVGAGGASCAANGTGNIADTIDLPVGGTATYSATCTIDAAATGTLDNTATLAVAAGSTDPNAANNSATDSDTLSPSADLSISKLDQGVPVPTLVGSSFSYLLTVDNAGPSTATGVMVSDSLPSTLNYVSNSCGASFAAPTLSWNIGTLAPGASVSCTLNVTVATLGTISNTASASSATADPTPANNAATSTLTGAQAVDVAISLSSDAGAGLAVGDSYSYTVTGSNLGVGLAGGLDFTLELSGKVSFVSSSCGAVLAGNTLSWSVATLADGASTSCEITVVVVLAGDLQASASVSTATLDPNLANNTAELAVAVAAIPIPALDRFGLLLLMLLSAGLGGVMLGRVRSA